MGTTYGHLQQVRIKNPTYNAEQLVPKTRLLRIGYIFKFDSPPIPGKRAAALYGVLQFISIDPKHVYLLLWPLTLHLPALLTKDSTNFNLTKTLNSVHTDVCFVWFAQITALFL